MVKYTTVQYIVSIWYTMHDDIQDLPLNKFEVNFQVSDVWMNFILIWALHNVNLCMPSTPHMDIVINV